MKLTDTHEYKPAELTNPDEMPEGNDSSSLQHAHVSPVTLEESKPKCLATLQRNTTLASLRRAAKVTGEHKRRQMNHAAHFRHDVR